MMCRACPRSNKSLHPTHCLVLGVPAPSDSPFPGRVHRLATVLIFSSNAAKGVLSRKVVTVLS